MGLFFMPVGEPAKPIHLKPGHLKMAFFSAMRRLDGAMRRLDGAFFLSRRRLPCLDTQVRLMVSCNAMEVLAALG